MFIRLFKGKRFSDFVQQLILLSIFNISTNIGVQPITFDCGETNIGVNYA
jgi:hypothetical protein